MRILLIALAIACLSACSFVGFPGVYKIDVEQGNIVTQEMADQLKPGMSRRQVRFIMGTPLIEDTFNQDRWDYPYVKRNGLNVLSESLLTVVFEGDTLVTVRGDYLPPAWSEQSGTEDEKPAESAAEEPETAQDSAETAG
jgi:outer membrane protein assembly factor BamE